MITIKQIAWVAGILEGEGYFGYSGNTPRITVGMTDEDTIDKVSNIIGGSRYTEIPKDIRTNNKTVFLAAVAGDTAIQWMMTIYSLMSSRRQAKIREILWNWSNKNTTGIYYVSGIPWCRVHNIPIIGTNIVFSNRNKVRCNTCRVAYRTKGITIKEALCKSKLLPA